MNIPGRQDEKRSVMIIQPLPVGFRHVVDFLWRMVPLHDLMSTRKWGRILLLGLLNLALYGTVSAQNIQDIFTYRQGDLFFQWDLKHDSASVTRIHEHASLWQGSLLPSFWLKVNHQKLFVKAKVLRVTAIPTGGVSVAQSKFTGHQKFRLALQFGTLGRGDLVISQEDWGIRFSELAIEWFKKPPSIIEMYFGASDEAVKASNVWPTWDKPFLPDWKSLLFCVPGAKGGTPQSYFRMWDFGQANVALGDFGPSMGSPYGAAYPRPLYYAGMGSDAGFIAFGAGSIPDAAMSLRVQSTRGCFQYVYDEDIWGALPGKKRVWAEPLRITLGDNAWMAFKKYYRSFPDRKTRSTTVPKVIWNTWGMWGQGKYLTRPISDFAKTIGADVLVMDGGWESSEGSGQPNLEKFPHFYEDLAYTRKAGMDVGLWESVGWIADPFSQGLKKEDLILDRNGNPCKANWNFDPSGTSFYCLDISSPRTREFIKQRTVNMMKTVKPAVLKLDFMYGLPSPPMGVPRDPQYRGERYGYALFHLIAATAKSFNPEVIIQGYSISPLWLNDLDMISMDDQGDLWYAIPQGHQQWSLWASLLSDKNILVGGSSGYTWQQDDEVILNSCILGPPGAVLPIYLQATQPVPDQYVNRRLAIDRWYRRTLNWTPLWLNSQYGGYTAPTRLNCWGRLENKGKDTVLTSLVLRADNPNQEKGWSHLSDSCTKAYPLVGQLKWKGRWALISQDDKSIFSTSSLALIPFDPGEIVLPSAEKPVRITRLDKTGETAFNQWKWNKGQLVIAVSDSLLEKTAGFLVEKK